MLAMRLGRGHGQHPEREGSPIARRGDRGFESVSLQGRVCEPSVPLGFRDRDILDLIGRTRDEGVKEPTNFAE
jgi:hypothetical protein